MAVNRMYLRCKKCGDTFLLGKTYMEGYFTDKDYYIEDFIDAINKFYEEHTYCNKAVIDKGEEPKFEQKEYDEENSYEICYEKYYKMEDK